ncbi:HNH endonuclease [Pseudorhizobium halotolerans]|uniref:HNH endonuclease n=1 Tax=Pseudorhizobium halotolerans TaxID=1233081 RepID=A0ABM8PZD2_9HYPH|nr:HNH endonuclease [Pseudorhizobium halotolerans]
MSISGHKVHRIAATAFLGEQPSSGHVVDHIDTNRCNNRPANLRWVTRLENILLNPITAKRVEALYGSIEEFLADPRNPKNGTLSREFEWMRTVSQAEAAYSLERMLAWAKSDRPSQGGSLGTWIFGRSMPPVGAPPPELVLSKTIGAVQRNWKIPAEFPQCPSIAGEAQLTRYYERLTPGTVVAVPPYTTTLVDKAAISEDGAKLYILGSHGDDEIKPWSLASVTFEDGKFVHESLGTFFSYERC